MSFSTLEGWTPREVPLDALAVVGRGAGAFALARRLLDRTDEELQRLRGASLSSGNNQEIDQAFLVVSGPLELLPWAPDAIYLGREAAAPALLWPIHLRPPFPCDLMERTLRRQFSASAAPLVLVPEWKISVPLGEALPIQRGFVTQFLARMS